jgi:hypothetical protein
VNLPSILQPITFGRDALIADDFQQSVEDFFMAFHQYEGEKRNEEIERIMDRTVTCPACPGTYPLREFFQMSGTTMSFKCPLCDQTIVTLE